MSSPQPRPVKKSLARHWAEAPDNPIKKHLLAGRSAAETARRCNLTTVRVYEFASRHSLPTNPTVKPGSTRETQIVSALRSGFGDEAVAALFRMHPSLLARYKKLARKNPTSG